MHAVKQKRARKFSKMALLWIFTPHFNIIRAFKTLHPSKSQMFWEVLVDNNVFYFLKRALPFTICNNLEITL